LSGSGVSWDDLLGVPEDHSADDFVDFGLGEGRSFELIERSSEPQYDRRRFQVAFEVEDIEGARQELIDRGVESISEIFPDHESPWTYFRDPEGTSLRSDSALAGSAIPSERSPRVREAVAAAREILEREGPEGLTMRRLAEQMGIRAPSLFKHVESKEDLEALLIADVFSEIGQLFHDAVARASNGGPRKEALAELGRAYRTWRSPTRTCIGS
jgi:hypothetical protein